MRTTWDRVLIAGDAVAAGTETAYRAVSAAPGEAHGVRADLCETHPGGIEPGEPILRLGHLTDLHLADTQSPLRLDFAMQVGERSPGWGGAVTYTFRPHELLTAHAADAMLRTLRGLGLDLCVVTGDSTDNAQANELAMFLALMDGGDVAPVSAGGVYRGPQSAEWGDPWYWVPEVPGDRYQHRWGYPHVPGLPAAAAAPFRAAGAGVPWIGCLGNHDVLVGGTTAVSDELDAIAVGGRKAVRLPADLGDERELELYLRDPVRLFSGPGVPVTADPERRLLRTRDIVRAHLGGGSVGTDAGGGGAGPAGHGYTDANLRDGTAYYRYDPFPGVRVLVLDTNHRRGMWDGNVDRVQLEWLADELRGLRGDDDPLVVIASHHATPSLGNGYGVCPDDDAAVAFAGELLEVALGCPNVVLWLNGHHHANRVVAHHRPSGGGLFEVTTASMVDWPTQARVIELVRQPGGMLRMTSTIVDHDAPLDPGPRPRTPGELASLHRQLAANDVWRGGARQGLTGTPPDRNVHLLVPLGGRARRGPL
ncbi:metallophosphoesterase [Jiangella muralis]|uniref:metallophosphoesterase n=1 Tax=Jiangella muralis TaxID=702383 RepID=UPI00069E10FE|nr:metallophosphoesterase [Jiangella muralis]